MKELIHYQSDDEDPTDEQSKLQIILIACIVRKNIKMVLAQKLKDITMDLRKNEKEHFLKVQEIHGEDILRPKSKKDMDRFLNDEQEMQMLETVEEDASFT